MLHSERLKNLQATVTNDAYLLYEALTELVTEDVGKITRAIEAACTYVRAIETAAAQARLMGLFAICHHTRQNLTKLTTLEATQLRELCGEVECWPRLVSNYIYSPAEEPLHHQLVIFLQNQQWPLPCSSELAEELLNSLLRDLNDEDSGDHEVVETKNEIEPFDNLTNEVANNNKNEINDGINESQVTNTQNKVSKLTVSSDDEQDNKIQEDNFEKPGVIQTVQSQDDQLGSKDSMTTGDLSFPLSGETSEILSDAQLDMMLEAETFFDDEKGVEAFDDNFYLKPHNISDSTPTESQLESNENEEDSSSLERSEAQISKTLADLSNQMVEMSDTLSIALNQFMTLSDETEAFLEGIEQYTNTVQYFWELAEEMNLKGFQNVCTFVNDNVFECSSRPQADRFKLLEQFALWPKLVLDYLQTPVNGANILVEHLRLETWPISMSEDQAKNLLTQLIQEAYVPQEEIDNTPSPSPAYDETVIDKYKIFTDKNNQIDYTPLEESIPVFPEAHLFGTETSDAPERLVNLSDWGEAFIEENVDLANDEDQEDWSLPSSAETPVNRDDSSRFHQPTILEEQVDEASAEEEADNDLWETADSWHELPLTTPAPTDTDFVDSDQWPEISTTESGEEHLILEEDFDDEQRWIIADLPEDLPPPSLSDSDTQSSVETNRENESETDVTSSTLDEDIETHFQPIQLASPEILDLVHAEISEAQSDLSKALNKFVSAEDESPTLLEAFEQYNDNVQSILEVANTENLKGLQEVCTFISDNVFELSTRAHAIRRAAQAHIEAWPALALAYLHSPLPGAQDLVIHLSSPVWPFALDETQSQALLVQLIPGVLGAETDAPVLSKSSGESDELPARVPNIPGEEITSSEVVPQEIALVTPEVLEGSTEDSTEKLVLAAPDILEVLIAQLIDLDDELSKSLHELVEADESSEALLTAIEVYTENVQSVWDAAEMAQLGGVQEVCTFVNENVMVLSEQDKSTKAEAQQVFAVWPQRVVAYLRQPMVETSTLINHLQDARWPNPLDAAAAEHLRQRLTTSASSSDEPPATSSPEELVEEPTTNIFLAEPDVLEVLVSQLTEVDKELSNIFDELLTADEGSEALLMAAENYTEQVQVVWETADMAGLVGLQDVCSFVNDNIISLGGQEKSAREAAHEVFAAWPQLVVAYLQKPAIESLVLVNHLQNTLWPMPLDAAARDQLQQRLIEGGHQQPDVVSTEPLASSSATTGEPTIYLAAPEVLEIVSNQIVDVTSGLEAVLEVCISMENENPEFLEALENYTNQVQAIWDAAEMAGLGGLQEVCTFVNDNIMAFASLDKNVKLASQTYFVQWPAKVLEYLQAPSSEASHLVSFLQEAGWPLPLAADAAPNLLNLLTQPAEVAQPEPNISTAIQEETSAVETIDMEKTPSEERPAIDVEIEEEISLGNAEVLEILRAELESAKEELATELDKFTTLANTDAAFAEVSETYTDHVQRLHAASEMLGLEGLQTVCTFVIENITALSTQDLAARSQAKKVLEAWPDLVLAYLQSPADSVIQMINHFRESEWAQPLSDDEAYALLNKLRAGSTAEEEEEEQPEHSRPKTANPEDVLLTIPEDMNRELLEAYLQETPQHASDFSACIQHIIQEPESSEINRAQRIAHTLKGSSNIIGIKGIANIAHHLEDTLEYLAKHQVVPPKELTNIMVEAADCIEIMVDALLGQDDPPQQAQQVLQSVLDWANHIDKEGLRGGSLPTPSRPAPETTPSATATQPQTQEKAETKPKAASDAAGTATPEQFLKVPTKTIDELMRLVGELSISVGQIHEKLKHVIHSTRTLTEQDLVLQQKTFELENLVDVRGITGVENHYRQVSATDDDEDFDPLEFEEYNELHSLAHSFIESIADNRELAISLRDDLAELETMFIHQVRLNKEFQNSIMTTRMVPASTIISKLQRNVRQTCRMTGKQAELDISGTDILMDSDVLNNLADPLMHVLRNAIDHGLEASDERQLVGKSETGTIKLSFYREGNNIVVSCQDDGQGLNYTNIRFTAIQRGLISETQELTEPELARLILMSGFSTKSGVTQVSGRGVGMDVVHTNIRQMKGTLDLLSETGKGTTILIKLPMTLVTVHVLLVRIGEGQFGIPTNYLEQALAPGVGEFHKFGDEISLKMDKNIYALKSLANLLNVSGDKEGIDEHETRPILLAHEETGITAVLVDELLDTHDLVMKNMGKYVTHIRGVAGAAILGDGSLVPLLDLPELLRSPIQAAMSSYLAEQTDENVAAPSSSAVPRIMIVDDSLSVRKSLSLLIEDAGFEALLAKDGLEAIEIMNQTRPNVMLVDMEMPRMNGLELTAHVRASQATQNLPIFMITSRTTEKHRDQAKAAGVNAYLTKPYQDAELLNLIDRALAGKI